MSLDFLAIGELLADLVTIENTAGLSDAKSFEIYQGGSPANVAANIRFMGKRATLISCVGNDGIGKFLINELKKSGLSDEHIQVSKTFPTSLVLVTKSVATPDFIAYRMADTQLQPIDKKIIESSSIIHTTAFALSQDPSSEVILRALEFAVSLDKIISIDWNFAPSVWMEDDGKDVFERIMKMAPVLKFSRDDLERFCGRKSIDEYKLFLDKFNCTFTCITCGKDGVWFRERNKEWGFKETIKVDKVIDTTGAGDAFWSGFICGYLDKMQIPECVDKGLISAAKKIQQKGPLYN